MAENILHFGAVRLRVNGSGNLDMKFIGLDDQIENNLKPLAMSATPGKEPLVLSNFKGQRARLRLSTDAINEYMIINRVVIFVKQLYTSYPG